MYNRSHKGVPEKFPSRQKFPFFLPPCSRSFAGGCRFSAAGSLKHSPSVSAAGNRKGRAAGSLNPESFPLHKPGLPVKQ
nr:hypothetical protein [Bacillaceae bacterium]